MTRTRSDIRNDFNNKLKEIEQLENEIKELIREDCLLSDDEQWYTEEDIKRRRGKEKAVIERHGRINRMELFTDKATGQKTSIHRARTVKINGEWVI